MRGIIDEKIKYIEEKEISITQQLSSGLENMKDAISEKTKEIEQIDERISENLSEELEEMKEKIEERLTNFEKHFNKRFLDYDTDFTTFKGVVVDEVEGLIRDVNTAIIDKTKQADTVISKLNFASNDIKNNIDLLNHMHKSFENEIKNIREEVEDLRVKFDITSAPHHSLQDHVNYMAAYENQLLSLIRSLAERGLSRDAIKNALAKKGHPQVYAAMLVDNYLYN